MLVGASADDVYVATDKQVEHWDGTGLTPLADAPVDVAVLALAADGDLLVWDATSDHVTRWHDGTEIGDLAPLVAGRVSVAADAASTWLTDGDRLARCAW